METLAASGDSVERTEVSLTSMEVKSRCIKSTKQQEKGYEVSTTKQGKWDEEHIHEYSAAYRKVKFNVIKRKLILQI